MTELHIQQSTLARLRQTNRVIVLVIILLLSIVSAFFVLNITHKTHLELHKKEQLIREYKYLLEERDNLFLEKEVLTNSIRIELLATYELNMYPIQPFENALHLTAG